MPLQNGKAKGTGSIHLPSLYHRGGLWVSLYVRGLTDLSRGQTVRQILCGLLCYWNTTFSILIWNDFALGNESCFLKYTILIYDSNVWHKAWKFSCPRCYAKVMFSPHKIVRGLAMTGLSSCSIALKKIQNILIRHSSNGAFQGSGNKSWKKQCKWT